MPRFLTYKHYEIINGYCFTLFKTFYEYPGFPASVCLGTFSGSAACLAGGNHCRNNPQPLALATFPQIPDFSGMIPNTQSQGVLSRLGPVAQRGNFLISVPFTRFPPFPFSLPHSFITFPEISSNKTTCTHMLVCFELEPKLT